MFLHFSALELPSFLGRSVISREFNRLICDIRCRTSLWNGGSDEMASTKWFEAKRHILRHDPNGVNKVIYALRYLIRKGRGRTEIRKTLGYFCNNLSRMNYYHLAKEAYPIRSGEGGGCKQSAGDPAPQTFRSTLGPGWRLGGLSFRALLKSDRFDRAWAMIVPRMERSKTGLPG